MKKIIVLLLLLTGTARAESMVVYLDWFLNPHHAPLVIALKQGLFQKHGLEVQLVACGGSEEGSKQVAAGNAHIAVSKQSSHLVRVVNQKLPIVRIATLIDQPLECLIADPAIKTIADLKGKRVGFSSSSIEFATYAIQTMLTHHGLALTDVTLVPIVSNMPTALLSGQVDAIFSAYRTYELSDICRHQPLVQVFNYEDHGVPVYEQGILVCHRDCIKDHQIAAFVAAIDEACKYIHDQPEAAWQAYAAHAPEQNTPANHDIFMAIIPYFSKAPAKLNSAAYEAFANFAGAGGLLKGERPALCDYAVEVK